MLREREIQNTLRAKGITIYHGKIKKEESGNLLKRVFHEVGFVKCTNTIENGNLWRTIIFKIVLATHRTLGAL